MTKKKSEEYYTVELEGIKAGTIADRPLLVHLSSNDKYIQLVNTLQFLEKRTIEKLRHYGKVLSVEKSTEDRYPKLIDSARKIRDVLSKEEYASFERHHHIKKEMAWLQEYLVPGLKNDPTPVAVFFHRIFEVPTSDTMQFLSDLSVDYYETSLKLSSLTGLLLMLCGYCDQHFVSQVAQSVFCEEVARLQDPLRASDTHLSDEDRTIAASMLSEGKIPGVSKIDLRFQLLVGKNQAVVATGDEVPVAVEIARALLKGTEPAPSRVWNKIVQQRKELELLSQKKNSKAQKEAA